MIFSNINAKSRLNVYPPALKRALDYCANTDFLAMEAGTYPLEGEAMYIMVMDFTSKLLADAHPERHETFVDIQFWPEGEEYFGVAPYSNGLGTVIKAAPEQDIWLYESVENESFLHATPGCYAIFFPEDIHRPGVCDGVPACYRKVVVKINTALLEG